VPRTRSAQLTALLGRILPVLIPIGLGGGWAVSIARLRLERMTDLGLVSAMPTVALVMLACLCVSFAVTVTRRNLNSTGALVHVLVLVVALYGVTSFVEPVPRFSSVYRHVGIIDYLLVHHSVNTGIDAYFSWPGFFALGALATKLAGWHSAVAFAAWGPLFFNLLFLPPLLAIFSWASDDVRVRWLAVWAFYSCNWVGQDYVSPQAVAFLLFLSVLALLLRWFTFSPVGLLSAPSIRWVRATFGPRMLRALAARMRAADQASAVGVMLIVLLMYAAIVSGHQLTPVPLIIVVAGLAVFAGSRVAGLPILMVVGLVAWIAFMTTTYLAGHISQVIGGLGVLGGTVSQGVGSRLGGSPDHHVIAQLRIAVSLAIWILAVAGFVRRLRTRRVDAAMMVLGASPFLLPLLQPYGGEIFLRVFLFALPGIAFFLALAAFPSGSAGRGWLTIPALALVGALLLLGFQFTRYGNERMDNFSRSDAAAVSALYRLAPRGANLMAGNDNLPWRGQGYADYNYLQVNNLQAWRERHPSSQALLAGIRHAFGTSGGYVILTRSNEVAAKLFEGIPGALPRLASELRRAPVARTVYSRPGEEIFYLAPTPRAPETTIRGGCATSCFGRSCPCTNGWSSTPAFTGPS
jgi:hypothetical protein